MCFAGGCGLIKPSRVPCTAVYLPTGHTLFLLPDVLPHLGPDDPCNWGMLSMYLFGNISSKGILLGLVCSPRLTCWEVGERIFRVGLVEMGALPLEFWTGPVPTCMFL